MGGIIYCTLCIMDDYNHVDDIGNPFSKTNIFKFGIIIFCGFTIISFFIFGFSYKSLRIRAITKLFYISD